MNITNNEYEIKCATESCKRFSVNVDNFCKGDINNCPLYTKVSKTLSVNNSLLKTLSKMPVMRAPTLHQLLDIEYENSAT